MLGSVLNDKLFFAGGKRLYYWVRNTYRMSYTYRHIRRAYRGYSSFSLLRQRSLTKIEITNRSLETSENARDASSSSSPSPESPPEPEARRKQGIAPRIEGAPIAHRLLKERIPDRLGGSPPGREGLLPELLWPSCRTPSPPAASPPQTLRKGRANLSFSP